MHVTMTVCETEKRIAAQPIHGQYIFASANVTQAVVCAIL